MAPDYPALVMSGGIAVQTTSPYTRICRLDWNIRQDKGGLSIYNAHTSATMYFKWFSLDYQGDFLPNDAGVVLTAGRGFSWDVLPRGRQLMGQSTVAGAICAVELTALLLGGPLGGL